MARVNLVDDMRPLIESIIKRIRRIRHQTVAGAFLLGDEDGNLYLLAEGAGTTASLVDAHMTWYVGSYGMGDAPVFPSIDDLLGDLRAHFAELVPALLYEAIRSEEG